MTGIRLAVQALFFASFTLSLSGVSAQSFSRPLPANTGPGLVELQSGEAGPAFASLELDGWQIFQAIADLPLSAIKGDRSQAVANTIACYPAAERQTCLIDVTADGFREIWLYRGASNDTKQTVVRLPHEAVDDLFFAAPRSSISGDGPLAFVATPKGAKKGMVWLESGLPDNPFHSYQLLQEGQVAITRPSINGKALAGLFLILTSTQERLAHPARGIAIIAAGRDGSFSTYGVPPDCEVLGAINDKLVCGERTRRLSQSSGLTQYPHIVRLRLPRGTNQSISRDAGAPAFHAIGNAILLRGFTKGLARPFIQKSDGQMAQVALRDPSNCVAPFEHVDVFEVSASQRAVLLKVFSPITPTRFILAPVHEDQLDICARSAQVFLRQFSDIDDHSQFAIQRRVLPIAKPFPITLVSGTGAGPLKDHTLLITYGVSSVWLPEDYLGSWLKHWVAEGGKVAFAHLPGGGGYGAKWSRQGFGIKGKVASSVALDQVTAHLVEEGLSVDGKVAVLTESGGGPLAAHAILRNPARYSVLAIRAGCVAIEGEGGDNCARSFEYGNWSNAADRALMMEFEPLERILQSEDFPEILLGVPQFDETIDLEYQLRMETALAAAGAQSFRFPGVHHTDRSTPKIEAQWVRKIAERAMETE